MNEELKDFLDKKLNKERPEPLQQKEGRQPFGIYVVGFLLVAVLAGIISAFVAPENKWLFYVMMFVSLLCGAWYFGRQTRQDIDRNK